MRSLRPRGHEMDSQDHPRILLVDDEPNILEAHRRSLRNLFEVVTAADGAGALQTLKQNGPFATIVSDLRMPEMDGVALLQQARQAAPDTVRVLFTGQPDLKNAIAAVNEGAIFRFLIKPCPPETLRKTLEAAVQQYRLVTSEHILLEQTLRGSIKAVTDILALANPAAFGRALRARTAVIAVMDYFAIADRWAVEVAAMLSQIGFVALPRATIEKLYQGQPVTREEQGMIARLPAVVEDILANIPRLDPVRQILRYHQKGYDGTGMPYDDVRGQKIPWGARVLRIVLDLDALEAQEVPLDLALDTLRGRSGSYDPSILQALAEIRGDSRAGSKAIVKEVSVSQLKVGMVLADDVKTSKGLLLVARGQEVTPGLTERIKNFSQEAGVREPIRVIVSAVPASVTAPA